MKWIKDLLSDAKAVLLAPIANVLCVVGVALIVLSFVDYDTKDGLSLHGAIHWYPAIAGLLLVALSLICFYSSKMISPRTRLDYNKGTDIKHGGLSIHIKAGEIQSIDNASRTCAVVLPVNTTFVDDCATDKRTATGAFFLERFPEEIAGLPKLFATVLAEQGFRASSGGQFSPGTTIVLPERFAKPAKVVITASTVRAPGTGITSSPHIICTSLEGIFRCTADQRVDTVILPILGSGHGGVDRGLALLLMILAALHFSKVYHHIRHINIVVHPKDIQSLSESKELNQIIAM